MPRSEPNFMMLPEDAAIESVEKLRRQALRLIHGEAPAGERSERGGPSAFFSKAAESAAEDTAPGRALMVGVVTMPAVFLVVVLLSLSLFGRPAPRTGSSPARAAVDTLVQPAQKQATGATFSSTGRTTARIPAIHLDEDAKVADLALDGDRVALYVEGPMGRQIYVYDYALGRMISETPIETAALDAGDSLGMLTGPPVASVKLTPPTPSKKSADAD